VQQADGKRIAGACRVYLIGGSGINVQFAGGRVSIRAGLSSRYYYPLKSITLYGAHGLEHPRRSYIVVLRL
jgi:hypothetical protein